jgi:deazaflavin-dependent oxidoreductase (nitroreductase family)
MSPEDAQPTRKPPPQIPADMNAFNQGVIKEYRANKGKLSGPMEGRTVMLLTTTGAKSGQPRTVVLGYGKEGDRLVVIASKNGATNNPTWYENLQAKPTVTVELGADKYQARARTAGKDERPNLAKLVPYLESQQKLTTREIPLVVLERA